MFSQFDNEEVDAYFHRLNAQLKKMPSEDRAEMHQELRQHLDALTAAHEELGATSQEAAEAALRQFGDPVKIGKRMVREWRETHYGGVKRTVLAALFAPSLLLMFFFAWALFQLQITSEWVAFVLAILCPPLLAGGIAGLCFPRNGLVGSVYGFSIPISLLLGYNVFLATAASGHSLLMTSNLDDEALQSLHRLQVSGLYALFILSVGVLSAYTASALRQKKFYRLHRADFRFWARQV